MNGCIGLAFYMDCSNTQFRQFSLKQVRESNNRIGALIAVDYPG